MSWKDPRFENDDVVTATTSTLFSRGQKAAKACDLHTGLCCGRAGIQRLACNFLNTENSNHDDNDTQMYIATVTGGFL